MLAFILLIAPVLLPLASIIATLEVMEDWHWHLALAVPGLILLAILGFLRAKPNDVFIRALALMNVGMAADLSLGHFVKSDIEVMYDWIPLTILLPLPWCVVMWFRSGDEDISRKVRQRVRLAASNTIGMVLISLPVVLFSYPVWFGIMASAAVTQFDNVQILQSMRISPLYYSVDDRKFLKHLLQTRYLWYDEGRVARADRNGSLETFFKQAVDPLDTWSYFEGYKDYKSDEMGYRNGTGITDFRLLADQLLILQVQPGSPAARAGLKRGSAILRRDRASVVAIDPPAPKEIDKARVTFMVSGQGREVEKVSITKENFKSVLVGEPKIFDVAGRKVGYLQFDDFSEIAMEPLTVAMRTLRKENIAELILDLRYNGGGSAQMVGVLAGMLAPKGATDLTGSRLTYKPSRAIAEATSPISRLQVRAVGSPTRLVVITSENTCSAAEALIMALRPYMEVVVIGSRSCGKPYGMELVGYNDKVFALISFSVKNSRGEMSDAAGIKPTCLAADDPNYELGDAREASFAEALFYSEHGRCSSGMGD